MQMGEDDRIDLVGANADFFELFVDRLTRFLAPGMVIGHRLLRIAHARVHQQLAPAALDQKGEDRMRDDLPGALSESGVLGFVQLLKSGVYQTNAIVSHACSDLRSTCVAGLIRFFYGCGRSCCISRALALQLAVLFKNRRRGITVGDKRGNQFTIHQTEDRLNSMRAHS